MQINELLKKAGLDVNLKDLPHIHTLNIAPPGYIPSLPENTIRTVEGLAISFELVTNSKEIVLALTQLRHEQLYRLLTQLACELRKKVEELGSEMIFLNLNGKTFLASEVHSLNHSCILIHLA